MKKMLFGILFLMQVSCLQSSEIPDLESPVDNDIKVDTMYGAHSQPVRYSSPFDAIDFAVVCNYLQDNNPEDVKRLQKRYQAELAKAVFDYDASRNGTMIKFYEVGHQFAEEDERIGQLYRRYTDIIEQKKHYMNNHCPKKKRSQVQQEIVALEAQQKELLDDVQRIQTEGQKIDQRLQSRSCFVSNSRIKSLLDRFDAFFDTYTI